MTAALLVLALVVAALAATLTVRRTDKDPTVHRIDTRTTPDEATAAALPPGYDDPASLAYVPEELRPYWPAPLDRLDERDAATEWGSTARRDLGWADPTHRARFEAVGPRVGRDFPDVGLWMRRMHPGRGALPDLTPAERDRAVHLARLTRAAAARRAVETERRNAESRARYTCPVCGALKQTALPTLCTACGDVADALARDEASARILDDGRTRRDAVRDWLDRH